MVYVCEVGVGVLYTEYMQAWLGAGGGGCQARVTTVGRRVERYLVGVAVRTRVVVGGGWRVCKVECRGPVLAPGTQRILLGVERRGRGGHVF